MANPTGLGGLLPTDLQYTGQRRETALGIYDYKARFYSPRLGRFLSADTLVPGVGSQHLNRYMYVTGNALRYTDPSGHCAVCVFVLLAILTVGCQAQQPVLPPSRSMPQDTTVNIMDRDGNHVALGTMISNDTILSHNHPQRPLSEYVIADPAGNSQSLVEGMSDPVGQNVVIGSRGVDTGQQTRLTTLPNQLVGSSAQIAPQNVINGLQIGDYVDIAYWDDANSQIAFGQFTISDISNLGNGAISVNNPNGVLNPGDSGGGVYFNGQLIGNLWSVVGGGHIALIPPTVDNTSRANTQVK